MCVVIAVLLIAGQLSDRFSTEAVIVILLVMGFGAAKFAKREEASV